MLLMVPVQISFYVLLLLIPQTKVNIIFFFYSIYETGEKLYKSQKNVLFKPGKIYINKLVKVNKYI